MIENIIRVEHSKENPYLQVCRKTIRDQALDLQALGLLVFLLDKPTNWKVRPEALAKERGVGQATIYRILNRLIEAGYVHRELQKRVVEGKGRGRYACETGAIYIVFEARDEKREWADRGRFEPIQGKFNDEGIPF